MLLSWYDIKERALKFSKKWENAKDERAEAQSFLNDFFDVFGVDRKRVATFETKVPKEKNRNGYIDLLWKGIILIEMKSKGLNLDKAYIQARDYLFNLEDDDLPEYTMVCDFENIRLYCNNTGQIWTIKTSQLYQNIKLFSVLAGHEKVNILPVDKKVDINAAIKMAKLHDILKLHGYTGHNLEVYLVRLLFCLFADHTGIFETNIFYDYISKSKVDGSDLSYRLGKLFEILDTPISERDKQTLLSEELKRFSYINGTLFREKLPLADFDYKMRKILLECCCLNWGYISPAIFGSIFQGVMNQHERRLVGAHYTSEENILKLIKPLFLDELWEEFNKKKNNSKQLKEFHDKLCKLTFLDPACGCGNFLIISYREIRTLELEVLKLLYKDYRQFTIMNINNYCKVNVDQFYGIEIEEFPSQIAKVGMWLIDHQMNTIVAEYFGIYYARLPLKQSAKIINDNALMINWESIISKNDLSYILGNPPFVGARYKNEEQKSELFKVLGDVNGAGNLDYVAAWFIKAANFMNGSNTLSAFVATNSIAQGEQVKLLWNVLFEKYKIQINFAYQTFKWSNEARGKAAVHCVIIGFSSFATDRKKLIYDENSIKTFAKNINPYLIDAPTFFISRRSLPLCNVPQMHFGSMANDGGFLILNKEEKNEIIKHEPIAAKYIHTFMMGYEFINNIERYCLWLVDATPLELKKMPMVLERIYNVQKIRSQSKRSATKDLSNTPSLFGEIRQPNTTYIAVPKVSSEKRKYIPIGFLESEVIAGDKLFLIPNASLYHFGILTSKVHMAWVRTVAGRLKSDYSYSNTIVYNNFPWPEHTEKQKEKIEKAAKEILDARALYPDTSFADLYNSLTMPVELLKAHNKLDKAVISAYSSSRFNTEAEIVENLIKRYHKLIDKHNIIINKKSVKKLNKKAENQYVINV
ncbi:MAG: DNA methyltransferase [Sedimentibacter saalensis]|uniref:DNA methyltransferase n=1 Tax=Sedimentibacter saalensis TaxID=130788 RepID=UPI003158A900